MIVDAHFHCWHLARGDYGWLTPALAPIYRDVGVADWYEQAAPHGVACGILVQAAPTEAETAFLLAQGRAHAMVAGVVGWVDMLAPDAAARVRQLATNPLLKGLRPMLQDIADLRWVLMPALKPALDAMTECGLVFDALVKPEHLPHILDLAQRHPALRIVIDHAAKPGIAQGQWQPWADDLARIADRTSAMCKLSGLFTEAERPLGSDAVRRWATHALACFGPGRVVWGSDWPVLELAAGYAAWWCETQELLAGFTAPERDAVLGGNAEQFYGIPRSTHVGPSGDEAGTR